VFPRHQSLHGWPILLGEEGSGLKIVVTVAGKRIYIHWQTECHLQLVAGGTTTACLLAF